MMIFLLIVMATVGWAAPSSSQEYEGVSKADFNRPHQEHNVENNSENQDLAKLHEQKEHRVRRTADPVDWAEEWSG